jgi:hypothetical protein
MIKTVSNPPRVFKTGWFNKHATKVGIKDAELCEVAKELMQGLWDADLGGNVYKKRLNENRHRSIVITKTAYYWIFTYLFAKADRDNISSDELKAFKKLAKDYSVLSNEVIDTQVANKDLMEICNDCTN